MDNLRTSLATYAEDDYREFIMKFIPSERPFLGVRSPIIRTVVKNLSDLDRKEVLNSKPIAFEEVLARGMIIAQLPYTEMLKYFDSQVELIDDWCSCDTFCAEVSKKIKKHREEFLELKIEPLIKSRDEFDVRVGLVILKAAYMDFDYLALIFDRVEGLKLRDEYYIKMGIAWLIAECFIKFPEPTFAYLKVSKLPKWTFNKTISKICDSYRVEPEAKTELKKLRK